MKVSPTQLTLIQIAMGAVVKGMFYPMKRSWNPVTKEFVYIWGAKYANAIKAMIRAGIANSVPTLGAYAFQLTPDTIQAYETGDIQATR